jgi:tetratricopeptide (TPR) repeat protein
MKMRWSLHPQRLLGVARERGVVFGVFALCVAGLVSVGSPASPLCLLRADFLHGLGQVESAVGVYDQIADAGLSASLRREALHRSAVLMRIELERPMEARSRFERLAKTYVVDSDRSEAWHQVALILAESGADPEGAARAFEQSAALLGTREPAVALWMSAAQQWVRSGQGARSKQIWLTLTERFPSHRSAAYVALGQYSLGREFAGVALSWFEHAVDHAKTEDGRGLAKMGVAICLERLGNLDEAIAELDSADFPEDVREVRRRKMRERSDQLQLE